MVPGGSHPVPMRHASTPQAVASAPGTPRRRTRHGARPCGASCRPARRGRQGQYRCVTYGLSITGLTRRVEATDAGEGPQGTCLLPFGGGMSKGVSGARGGTGRVAYGESAAASPLLPV